MKFTLQPARRRTGNSWLVADQRIDAKAVKVSESGEVSIRLTKCRMGDDTSEYKGELTLDVEELYGLLGQLEKQKFALLAEKQNKPFKFSFGQSDGVA